MMNYTRVFFLFLLLVLFSASAQAQPDWRRWFSTAKNIGLNAVAVGDTGRIYVAGAVTSNVDGKPYAYIGCLNSSGIPLWHKHLSYASEAVALTVLKNDTLAVGIVSRDENPPLNSLLRLDGIGSYISLTHVPSAPGVSHRTAFFRNRSTNALYWIGDASECGADPKCVGAYIARSNNRNHLDARLLQLSDGQPDVATDLAGAPDGSLAMTGGMFPTNGNPVGAVVIMDAALNLSRAYESNGTDSIYFDKITYLDGDAFPYLVAGRVGSRNILVLKFNRLGEPAPGWPLIGGFSQQVLPTALSAYADEIILSVAFPEEPQPAGAVWRISQSTVKGRLIIPEVGTKFHLNGQFASGNDVIFTGGLENGAFALKTDRFNLNICNSIDTVLDPLPYPMVLKARAGLKWGVPTVRDAGFLPMQFDSVQYGDPCCLYLQPELSVSVLCAGADTEFRITMPGNQPMRFLWDFEDDKQIDDLTAERFVSHKYAGPGRYTLRVYVIDDRYNCTAERTLDFEITDGGFQVLAFSRDTTICAEDTLTLRVQTAELAPISWGPPAFFQVPENAGQRLLLKPGDYIFTCRIGDGPCAIDTSVRVTVRPQPTADAGPDQVACPGGTIQLNGKGGGRYHWEPKARVENSEIANPAAFVPTPTYFILTVTDAFGCADADTMFADVIRLNVGRDTTICLQKDTLILRATTNGSNCDYRWSTDYQIVSGGVKAPVIRVTPARDTCYILEATCNNCVIQDTVCIRLKAAPNVRVAPDTTVCRGQSVRLWAEGGASYEWRPATYLNADSIADPVSTPLSSTVYEVLVSEGDGCVVSKKVKVQVLPLGFIDLPNDTTVCPGQSIRLTAGAADPDLRFNWTPAAAFAPGQAVKPDPIVLAVDSLLLKVRVSHIGNGCARRDSILIHVLPKPTGVISGRKVICQGEAERLSATGAERFYWVNTPLPGFFPSVIVQPMKSTTYKAVPYNGSCVGDTLSFAMTVDSLPNLRLELSKSTLCTLDTLAVRLLPANPQGTLLWLWDGGDTIVLKADTLGARWAEGGFKKITARLKTPGGCFAEATATIDVHDRPIVRSVNTLSACADDLPMKLEGFILNHGPYPCAVRWTPETALDNPGGLNTLAWPDSGAKYVLEATCGGCSSRSDTLNIIVWQTPKLTSTRSRYAYCTNESGVILETQTEGADYAYQWTPSFGLDDANSASPRANPGVDTSYTLMATDRHGCIAGPIIVEVRANDPPIADAGPDQWICKGQAQGVFLNGNADGSPGPFHYQWTPTAGLSQPDAATTFAAPEGTTIYTLTVVDIITGCVSSATAIDSVSNVIVHVEDRPAANAGQDTLKLCLGDSVRLGGVHGNAVLSYTWTPNVYLSSDTAAHPSARPPFDLTYYLNVETSHCRSLSDSVFIDVQELPSVTFAPADAICPGDTAWLRPVFKDADPQTLRFKWTPNVADSSAAATFAFPEETTTYTLTVVGVACPQPLLTYHTVPVLKRPTLAANPDSLTPLLCMGQYFDLPARVTNATFFEWQPARGLSDPYVLNPKANPAATTTYTITAWDGPCSVQDSITIRVAPDFQLTITGSDASVCAGDTVRLTVNANQNNVLTRWRWQQNGLESSSDERELVFTPEYSTRIILDAQLGECHKSDTFALTVRPNIKVQFETTPTQGCAPLTVNFRNRSARGVSWKWDFGDGSAFSNELDAVHVFLEKGEYQVQLLMMDDDSCTVNKEATQRLLVYAAPIAHFTGNPPANATLYLPEAEVTFEHHDDATTDWLWDFGDNQTGRHATERHRFESAGTYYVTLIASNAHLCQDTAVVGPFNVLEPELFIPTVFTPNGDGANDRWRVDYSGAERFRVVLHDQWGKIVYATNHPDTGWDGMVNGNAATPGVYYYLVEVGSRKYTGSITLLR